MSQITDISLRAKNAANIGERLSDGGSLYGTVRVDRKGNIVVGFEYRYRSPITGKLRAIGCGIWPASSLKAIRLERDKYRLVVDSGADPLENKKAEKLAAQAEQAEALLAEQRRLDQVAELGARLKVRDLFDKWEKTELIEHVDKGKEVRRKFEKDVFPMIGDMAAEDVRKGHIMAVVDKVKERLGMSRTTRVTFELLRQMMRFAVDRDLIESDPTSAIRKEKAVGKDNERDRVLSEVELKQLAKALPTCVPKQIELAVWLMTSTLCRVGELSKAAWADIDLDNKRWRIPADVAKNRKEHIVSLSDFAVEKFTELKALKLSDVWAYPSRNGKKHINDKAINKQLRDRQRTKPLKGRAKGDKLGALILSGGEWTSHDLRRTGATTMGELGIDGDTIERCLNHTEQNRIKRTYQRQRNEQAMIEAWQELGIRLAVLTSGADNVVTLESAKKQQTAA